MLNKCKLWHKDNDVWLVDINNRADFEGGELAFFEAYTWKNHPNELKSFKTPGLFNNHTCCQFYTGHVSTCFKKLDLSQQGLKPWPEHLQHARQTLSHCVGKVHMCYHIIYIHSVSGMEWDIWHI